jgi:hypothetical protein
MAPKNEGPESMPGVHWSVSRFDGIQPDERRIFCLRHERSCDVDDLKGPFSFLLLLAAC